MRVRRLLAATTAVFTVAGIVTACSSVPDVTFGDEEDGGGSDVVLADRAPGFDTGPKQDAGGDTSVDAPKDAPADVPPICTPTNGGVEDCDDGIDNDCNGKVDCADTACNALYECIPTPPVGWSIVAESDTTRPTCPGDYPTARDIELVQGTGAGTCACSCALANGTEACGLQQSTVTVSSNATCADNVTGSPESVAALATNCTTLTTNIDIPNAGNPGGKTVGPTAPPSGCTANVTPTSIPPITQGRTCAPSATPTFGGGCQIGQVCAKKAPAGLNLCVQKSGANACPTNGYTSLRSAGGATLADGGIPDGGATQDNRSCRSCNCSSPTCLNPTVTLYENADCSGANITGALPTTCTATTKKGFTAKAYKSSVTPGGCTPIAFDATTQNAIAFTDPTTVCCKP